MNWSKAQQSAFDQLKYALANDPVLNSLIIPYPCSIISDASEHGIGSVLVQIDDEVLFDQLLIAYFSCKFQNRQDSWSTYQQERFSIVELIKHFRPYIEGKKVSL